MGKKILFINATLNWGSTGRISEQLATKAEELGFECIIAHGSRYVGKSAFRTYKIGSKLTDYFHVVESLLLGRHGLGSRIVTRKFIRYIEEIQPVIIHLHNIHGYYVNYSILFDYLRKANIPVVWTLHDCWSMTGHCTHFDQIGCEKWKNGCHNCPLLNIDYRSLLFDRSRENYFRKKLCFTSLKNVHVVTVSKWLAGIAQQSFLSKYPIQFIYNGVDTNVFKFTESDAKQKLGIGNKYMLLGVATAWDKNKGLFDYIELSKRLPEKYQIVMIGVSPSVKHLLPENIIGLERTQDIDELVKYYSAADIVLNLSYLETFGLTTVEGMSCGTPSIVYDRTASPELMLEDTGAVVKAGDIDAVVIEIEKICGKGRTSYSDACRNRVLSHFEKNRNSEEYLELYTQILNNNES